MPKLVGTLAVCLLAAFGLAQTGQYVVQPGDTLYRIASAHSSSVAELARLNNLTDPNALEVGQVLAVPGALELPPLSAPFKALTMLPQWPVQGQTFIITAELETPMPLRVRFLDFDYDLAQTDTGAKGAAAVPVLQQAGVYTMEISSPSDPSLQLSLPVRVMTGSYRREAITLPPSTGPGVPQEVIRDELDYVRSYCRAFEPEPRWTGTFRFPIPNPYFTSAFGTTRSYNGGPYSSYHEGLDIRGNSSTPVYAAADGVVAIAERLRVRGNSVYVHHGWNVCSGYIHLDRVTVAPGQEVRQGDMIGYAGATGAFVTGPHLHWEVRVGGIPVDPRQWVDSVVGLD